MPDLQLNRDSLLDPLWMYATMVHPKNERYREEFVAVNMAFCILGGGIKENEEDIEIPSSLLSVLLNAPARSQVIKRFENSSVEGSIAGDVLLYIAEMYLTKHKEPSLRKAIYASERYLANASDGYGNKKSSSQQSIRRYWEKYKPVAHLWAAYRMLQLRQENPRSLALPEKIDQEPDQFLAIAEGFRIFGENFAPSRPKKPTTILQKDETWKVPESYVLPTMYISIEEMHDDLKGFLNDYRAPVDINL